MISNLDWSSRAIPAGGGRDSAASKTDRSMAKVSRSTSFHLCDGFCSSNNLDETKYVPMSVKKQLPVKQWCSHVGWFFVN